MARPGTNYNERMRQGIRRDADIHALAAAAAQGDRCKQGEHDVTVAAANRTTYVRGRRVEPRTRYCRYCSALLGEDVAR